MIINGGSRAGGRGIARHLERTDTNEVAQLVQLTGTAATDLDGALREMEAVASGTRCKYPLYHANIDPPADVSLSPAQWRHSVDTLEKALGLTGQPRAVVRHIKGGREHMHVVWSRIDTERMRTISDSKNYKIHEQVSRQLEKEFGHRQIDGVHTGDKSKARPVVKANQAEQQQAERTGLTVEQITADIQAAWQRSDDGNSFAHALSGAGYMLARGDRRDFVIVDSEGGIHNPRRRLGVKAAEVKERCADLDPATLPTVEEAREMQQLAAERKPAEPEKAAPAPAPSAATRSDTTPAPQASTATADSKQGDQLQRGTEAGMGLLERIFTKAAELFDAVREKLFGAAFAPLGDREEAPAPSPSAPAAAEKQPDRPRPVYEIYDPSKNVLGENDKDRDTRERDASDGRGRERTREWQPPPDPTEEPDGGET